MHKRPDSTLRLPPAARKVYIVDLSELNACGTPKLKFILFHQVNVMNTFLQTTIKHYYLKYHPDMGQVLYSIKATFPVV